MARKYRGIKKLASMTKCLTGYGGEYVQVFYDRKKDEVWGDYTVSLGQNSWNVYHDKNIVHIGNYCEPWTMKEIRKDIDRELADRDLYNR